MKTICYDCTRIFERENLVPLQDLFYFIPGEADPVGLCPRCGGLCLPEVVPSEPHMFIQPCAKCGAVSSVCECASVAMEAVLPSTPAAAALLSLNFMLAKSLP